VRGTGHDGSRPFGLERRGRLDHRTGRIDHVVDHDNVFARHVADDVHDFRHVRLFAAFVDDDHFEPELLREVARAGDAADVGAGDDRVGQVLLLDVLLEDDGTVEIVDRDVEEALDLAGVQVDGDQAVDARRLVEVRHQLRADGNARRRFAVLTRVAEIRDDGCNGVCRRAAQRIGHDKQLHQVVVGRGSRGLDDKDVTPADAL